MRDPRETRLREVVRRFYVVHADAFSAKRERPWRGWRRLLEHMPSTWTPSGRPLRVLDAGCGNGRFGVFLADALGADSFEYRGVDSSPRLLEIAAERLGGRGIAHDLVDLDLLAETLDGLGAGYDLIALMGVLHHVPGEEARGRLLRRLGRRLAHEPESGGESLLVATVWRPDDRLVADGASLDGEPGDLLLPFDGDASTPRYCHAADEAEVERLIAASGLALVDCYEADGRDGRGNLYLLLRSLAPLR